MTLIVNGKERHIEIRQWKDDTKKWGEDFSWAVFKEYVDGNENFEIHENGVMTESSFKECCELFEEEVFFYNIGRCSFFFGERMGECYDEKSKSFVEFCDPCLLFTHD